MNLESKSAMIVLENNKPYCPYCLIGMVVEMDADGNTHWIRCKNGFCPNFNCIESEKP